MKIRFLLLGTSLSFIPSLTFAQCVATQDCETLGYTETSCNGGKGVKCPFGNKWACFKSDAECKQQFCTSYGFNYTCTNSNQSGGGGQACNGKYVYCKCTSGYEWKNGNCQKQEVLNGSDGDVYKCNGKVVGVKVSGMNFYVAMQDLGEMYWDEANNQSSSFVFCNYLKGILPSSDQLMTINKNKTKLNEILATYGGTNLIIGGTYWSSTYVVSGVSHYSVSLKDNPPNMGWGSDNVNHYVRPVLATY